MLKKYRIPIIIFFLLAAGAMVAAYFYDLKLDIRLNDPDNAFAVWLRNTGEMPGRIAPIAAGIVLLRCTTKRWQKFCGLLLVTAGSVHMGYDLGDMFFKDEHKVLFSVLWGVGYALLFLFFSHFVTVPKKYKRALITMAVVCVCVFASAMLINTGMKYLWGRVRFRTLLADGSFDAFTGFWVINGVNGNRSFPSGHTANAAMFYLAMLLPYLNKKIRKYWFLCWLVPFLYTSAVAYSRLVMGAHYLSDVTVGGMIGFSCVLIGMYVFERLDAKRHLLPYS
ncbi:MAG: phosphatase PAP2 family protein [Clostridia bacterium]|nr:phosphatase PAP2 family protein [Clostridia bacterium]